MPLQVQPGGSAVPRGAMLLGTIHPTAAVWKGEGCWGGDSRAGESWAAMRMATLNGSHF